MKRFLFGFMVISMGCSHLPQQTENPEETQMIAAEKVLESGRFDEALGLFQRFQKNHPQSIYLQSARMGEGKSLEGLSDFKQALEIYRSITFNTANVNPEIAAQALYRMSFAYEAMGDDLKMVAVLLDAQKRSAYLPLEIALAQIPAKLAVAYARQSRMDEAVAYLNDAERGMAKVFNEKGRTLSPEWLARVYFEMGSVSTNQLSAESFEDFVRSQKIVQVYLLKSLKQNNSYWSSRSLSRLQDTYRDLDIQVDKIKGDSKVLGQLGGTFVDLMNQADLFRPDDSKVANEYEAKFYAYLDLIRKKTEAELYRNRELNSLTLESQRLNSIKRPGRVQVDSYLPEEEKSFISLPPKVVPSEDPNL